MVTVGRKTRPLRSAFLSSLIRNAHALHLNSKPTFSTVNKNPLNKGILTENAIGIGTVTPEMVEARAHELAAIAGRVASQLSEVDYEQAQRELTGGPEMDVEEAVLESIPESERWNPVPGSTGSHTPDSLGEDEDSEGRSESAQLVEEGIKEAEHDQMLQAARAAQEEDQREA
jgi:hypothetical protein